MEVFLTILALATLSLLATSRTLYRMQRHRALAGIATGGWPVVFVGFLIGPAGLEIIPFEIVLRTTPLILVALGWIGFTIGLQLRLDVLRAVPGQIRTIAAIDTPVTLVAFGLVSTIGTYLWVKQPSVGGLLVPIAVITTGCLGWAMETRSLHAGERDRSDALGMYLRISGGLMQAIAIILFGGLLLLGSQHDAETGRIVWGSFFTSLGLAAVLGVLCGILGRFSLKVAGSSRPQQLAAFLGVVAFAAGIATQIEVSPLVACLVAGAVIANLPGWEQKLFERFIIEAEHVIAATLALLAGILMDIRLGVGGVLLCVALAGARAIVKPATLRLSLRRIIDDAPDASAGAVPSRSPMYLGPIRLSPLAPALAISAFVLHPSVFDRQILAVMLITGLLCELPPMLSGVRHRRAHDAARREPESGGEERVS